MCTYAVGKNSRGWEGGRHEKADGYVLLSGYRNHPRGKDRGLVQEHIIIMENHLGRYLKPDENVHHKNGIRNDNRIENLELWASYQPSGQRVEDLIKFVAKQYSEEVLKQIKENALKGDNAIR